MRSGRGAKRARPILGDLSSAGSGGKRPGAGGIVRQLGQTGRQSGRLSGDHQSLPARDLLSDNRGLEERVLCGQTFTYLFFDGRPDASAEVSLKAETGAVDVCTSNRRTRK